MQIVHSSRRGGRDIEHLGSAHDEAELEALKAAAAQRLAAGQDVLDLGLDSAVDAVASSLEIVSSRPGHLWDALCRGYDPRRARPRRRDRGGGCRDGVGGQRKAIEAAGLSFILGAKITHVPYLMSQWRKNHPDTEIPDGHVFIQPWPPGPNDTRRDQVIYYQYEADRARRTLRGIDEQITKAEKAVAGKAPVKRNRFLTITGGAKSINRPLEAMARALAGLKGYLTNITSPTPEFVIGAYHQLWHIEKSFPCPNTTCAHGLSITTSANRSRPT